MRYRNGMLVVGLLSGIYVIMTYGYLLSLVGLTGTATGGAGLRRLAGPLAYLFFMIPLLHALYAILSLQMQL